MRYSIMVQEHGSDHFVELLQVNDNPEPLAESLRARRLTIHKDIFEPGKRRIKIPKYTTVRIVDHTPDGA